MRFAPSFLPERDAAKSTSYREALYGAPRRRGVSAKLYFIYIAAARNLLHSVNRNVNKYLLHYVEIVKQRLCVAHINSFIRIVVYINLCDSDRKVICWSFMTYTIANEEFISSFYCWITSKLISSSKVSCTIKVLFFFFSAHEHSCLFNSNFLLLPRHHLLCMRI